MEKKMKSKIESYELDIRCGNCKARGTIIIPKGVKPEDLICKECGCGELNQYSRGWGWSSEDKSFKDNDYTDHLNSQDQEEGAVINFTVEDTPEEWEERLGLEILETRKKGSTYSVFYFDDLLSKQAQKTLKTFIKQLLEDREREAKRELLEQLIVVVKNGTPEEFQKELDKLEPKEK